MSYHSKLTALILALKSGSHSYDDLCMMTMLGKSTVAKWIKEWEAEGAVHVSGWALDGRGYPTVKKFSWGSGTEAKRPSMTSAERVAKWRAKRAQKQP